MSRFHRPTYKMVAIDDVDFELIKEYREAARHKGNVTVIMAIDEFQRINIHEFKIDVVAINLTMVWTNDKSQISAAVLKTATIDVDSNEDEFLAALLAKQLVEFMESSSDSIEDVMAANFLEV
jgi:hypothetical protein